MTKEISGFSKEECLRLKGIIEPLEDIIVRHYGEDYKEKKLGNAYTSLLRNDIEPEESNLILLDGILNELKQLEKLNWDALLHKNDKLDV